MELAILGAVVGAVVGWALSYFLPGRDSKKLVQVQDALAQAHAALAQAEEARARTDAERHAMERRIAQLTGFTWSGRVVNRAPEPQVVEVEANEEVEVRRLTYCDSNDAGITAEDFEQPINGRRVRIPIRRDSLIQVQRVGYNPFDGSFNMRLKIGARVLGEYRELVLAAHVRQTLVGNTGYLDVFG